MTQINKQARGEIKPYPLGAYAPGNYQCTCGKCGKEFIGDKRAVRCLECSIVQLKETCMACIENRKAASLLQQQHEEKLTKLLNILRANQQAQIVGYYNIDKTDEERKIRNAVIEEYRDLILIFKHQFKTHNNEHGNKS